MLLSAPGSFAGVSLVDFAQSVRLLEANGLLTAGEARGRHGLKARFVCDISMRLQAAAISRVARDDAAGVLRLEVSGFSLTGAAGVLPYSYGALIRSELLHKNPGLKAFIDIFQHRPTHLFYRACVMGAVALAPERAHRGEPDAVTRLLSGLCGLSAPGRLGRLPLPDAAFMPFAALLAGQMRSASGLAALVAAAIGAPVRLTPLRGRWLSVSVDEQTRLGEPGVGRHARLGRDAMIGARLWSVAGAFELQIGPVSAQLFAALSPEGKLARRARALCDLYCGLAFQPQLRLLVAPEAITPARLAPSKATSRPETPGSGLGCDAWLLAGPATAARDDLCYPLFDPTPDG